MSAQEDEICLFMLFGSGTVGLLNARRKESQFIFQAEVNSTTDEGLRITNRVRGIGLPGSGKPNVYTQATKYRLPRAEGSVSSSCIEQEKAIDAESFGAVIRFMPTVHHKYRHTFELENGLKIEVDHYCNAGDNVGGQFGKVDIENGNEQDIPLYLETLRKLGIAYTQLINPPGVESPEIKETMTHYMGSVCNHAGA
jgi:hypothetical protein